MAAALTAAGVVVALGDAALLMTCWRSKSVLAGMLGLIGIPLVRLHVLVQQPARRVIRGS